MLLNYNPESLIVLPPLGELNDCQVKEICGNDRPYRRCVAINPPRTDNANHVPWEVGDKVYGHYCPQSPGVVVQTRSIHEYWVNGGSKTYGMKELVVKVMWLPKKREKVVQTSWVDERSLSSLDALIADHRKKIASHEGRVKELEELANSVVQSVLKGV